MFRHLSVSHYIEYTIGVLEDNFNILDENIRYPKDVMMIIDIIEYINSYSVSNLNDKSLYDLFSELVEIKGRMINKINKLTRNENLYRNIIDRIKGLSCDDLFILSDLCYNHLYEIMESFNDTETGEWNITENMSPNLLSLFNKTSSTAGSDNTTIAAASTWSKPAYHGLENSLPIIFINQGNKNYNVFNYNNNIGGDDKDNDYDEDDDDDYDDDDDTASYGIDISDDEFNSNDDSYVLRSNISDSLSALFINNTTTTTTTTTGGGGGGGGTSSVAVANTSKLSAENIVSTSNMNVTWKPPTAFGLQNSAPILTAKSSVMSQLSYSAATMRTPKAEDYHALGSSLGATTATTTTASATVDYPSIEEKHDYMNNNNYQGNNNNNNNNSYQGNNNNYQDNNYNNFQSKNSNNSSSSSSSFSYPMTLQGSYGFNSASMSTSYDFNSGSMNASYGVNSGSMNANYGVNSGSMNASYGVNSGSMNASYGVNSGSMNANYGVNSGSLNVSYGVSHDVEENDDEEEGEEEEEEDEYDDDDGDDYGDDETPPSAAMSESLMIALGMDVTSRPKVESDWVPPSNYGLDYSAPIIPTKFNGSSSIR